MKIQLNCRLVLAGLAWMALCVPASAVELLRINRCCGNAQRKAPEAGPILLRGSRLRSFLDKSLPLAGSADGLTRGDNYSLIIAGGKPGAASSLVNTVAGPNASLPATTMADEYAEPATQAPSAVEAVLSSAVYVIPPKP